MFIRPRAPGLFVLGSAISPLEFETIADFYRALDSNGGTYALAAALVLGGEGVTLSGAKHHITGTLTVDSLAILDVASGGLIRADGTAGDIRLEVTGGVAKLTAQTGTLVRVNAGAALDVYGGLAIKAGSPPGAVAFETGTSTDWQDGSEAMFSAGSNLTIADGAQVDLDGQILMSATGVLTAQADATIIGASGAHLTWQGAAGLSDLTLVGSSSYTKYSPARSWESTDVAPIPLSYSISGASKKPMLIWAPSDTLGAPTLATEAATSTGDKSVIQLRDLPIGALVTSVTLKTKGYSSGGGGGSPTVATYKLVSWDDAESAGFTDLSSTVNDTHSTGNFYSAALTTTVTPSGGSFTVERGKCYGVYVEHPADSGGAGQYFYKVRASGTISEHRP